jgi:hypothetical protein
MGNRGEGASRPNGAWGRQPPRQSSSGTGAVGAGAWDDRSRGNWQDDDYPTGGGAGYGYGPDDGYPGQEPGYGQDRQYEGQYGQYGAESEPGWGGNAGYEPDHAAGYDAGARAPQPGYGSGGQPRISGYRQSGGYPEVPQGSGGYPALPPGSGSYPVLPQNSGGYPEQDAGNDWYGGQPAAANGASFADTGTYRLNGRIIDEYGTGPRDALGDGEYGTGPRGARHDGDPGRGYPAAPSRQGHGQQGHGGSGGYPAAGGYDDYRDGGGYQAPGQYDQPGYDDYGQPAPYEGAPGGGRGGYDGYGDYGTPPDPYGERYDGGADSRDAERGGRGAARGGARGGRSGVRTLLLAALAVVVVGVAGVAAYVFVLKPKSPAANPSAAGPLPTGSAQPSQQQACMKQLGAYCHIELRSDDPTALTTAELFPPAFKIEKDKISYQLASTKVDKTCSTAVIGPDLTKALKSGKCTQVLRATYLSGDGKIMGTIGVVNLATTNGAHYAGKVVGKDDFIAPLTAAKGAAKKLGKGTGVVEAQFKGHYLILTWSEFVDGTTPSTTAQDKQLEQFGSDLVSGTANISLSQRMVTGAPSTPGAAS